MSEPLDKLDPERLLKALTKTAPLIQKRMEFLRSLKAEKGANHAAVAQLMFRHVSVVGLLATISGGIDSGKAFQTKEERNEAFQIAVGILNEASAEMARSLGVTDEELKEFADAATQFIDTIMFRL